MARASLAHAQTPVSTAGLVDVRGRPFPLLAARIHAHAGGGIAKTVLEQSYANPYEESLEVLYTMPLPADGSVIGYTILMGEKRITGEIKSREEAREVYQRALEEGRTAGLLEQDRADTFTQSLGSLPARVQVRVEVEVLQPLTFRAATSPAGEGDASPAGCWEYRFPTVVGVRYEGAPGSVPDADRLDVDRANEHGTPARFELDMTVADGEPERIAPRSPSHGLRVAPDIRTHGSRLALREPSLLNRDMVVHWEVTTAAVGLSLVKGRGLQGDDGSYGLLTITPPSHAEHSFTRDLTVLIDASGSMKGPPLEYAKKVVEHLLRSLGRGDRFEILAFSTTVEGVFEAPIEATERNTDTAVAALHRIEARGGTEMGRAIEQALRPLRGDSQRQVVLLTDGYIGFENRVIGNILRRLPGAARLHTVGIGAAPNRTLTRGAARAGRGVELMVGDDEGVETAADRLLKATIAPVLTDLSICGVRSVAPERPRDVLAGQALIVAVELEPNGGAVEVSGRLAGSDGPWSTRIDLSSGSVRRTELPLGALFGREAVEDQEMHLAGASYENVAPILGEIEKLGLRHRITSRRTSLVAISEEPTVDPHEPWRRERLAVEMPADVSAEGVGLRRDSRTDSVVMFGCLTDDFPERSLESARERPVRRLGRLVDPDVNEIPLFAERGPLASRLGAIGRSTRRRLQVGEEIRAYCVRLENDFLVIEIETPRGGFELARTDLRLWVRFKDGGRREAQIDPERSTRPGCYDAGRILRLALRTVDRSEWPRGEAIIEMPSMSATGATAAPAVILRVIIG